MTQGIAIIRAASMAPVLRWMEEHGVDTEAYLRAVHLDCFPVEDPLAVIPLRAAISLLVDVSRATGPDTPYRIISGRGFYELGLMGSIALGGDTPRDVLQRAVTAMPVHCSHEFLILEQGDRGLAVSYGIQLNLPDQESVHYLHQYFCALIQMVCAMTGLDGPHFSRVRIAAHPDYGFSHLQPYLGNRVSEGSIVEIVIPDEIADHPLDQKQDELISDLDQAEPGSLRTDGIVSGAVGFLVESMMQTTKPSIDCVADAAGISRRSLQRRLSAEGKSFSAIVEEVRKRVALSALLNGDVALGELSSRLGYADQATLSRAVRRWTGRPPSAVARHAETS